jgi:bacterial/archaeal transporter family-2 protein
MSTTTVAAIACLVAGASAAIQASLAGILGRRVGVLEATALTAFVGMVVILTVALIGGRGVGGVTAGVREPWWLWIVPGLVGAVVITTFTFAPPRIGVFATFALLIAGQLLVGVVIDATGLFGVDRFPLSGTRLAGLALLAAGALLVLKR